MRVRVYLRRNNPKTSSTNTIRTLCTSTCRQALLSPSLRVGCRTPGLHALYPLRSGGKGGGHRSLTMRRTRIAKTDHKRQAEGGYAHLGERHRGVFLQALVPEVRREFRREAVVAPQPRDVPREGASPGPDKGPTEPHTHTGERDTTRDSAVAGKQTRRSHACGD